MDFKDLPLKVQLVLLLMHNIGILEAMSQSQNLSQEEFQNVVVQSLASLGIDQNYMGDILEGLTAEEDRAMKDYLADHGMELADEYNEADDQDTPKVH